MIDFRYHVVSLVSVFMALAIGLALGAGALRGPASDALTSQVAGLREDKANLQLAVENRDAQIADQEQAIAALSSAGVADTLTDRSVAVIVLPGTDSAGPARMSELLESAGATTVSTVSIAPTWTRPSAENARAGALAELADEAAAVGVDSAGSQANQLAELLAYAVVGTSGGERDANGSAIISTLSAAGLITVAEDSPRLANLALVLVAGATNGAAGSDSEWQAAELSADQALVTALDDTGSGTVVVGPPESDAEGGLIAALRSGGGGISTVDDADTDLAAPALVLALAEQDRGRSGHYGTGVDATSVVPSLQPDTSSTQTP
ncbi:MAG: copper transporter [Actinomycetales bacterium]